MRLINDDHVAPPASDTNDNGDFSRNQFLQGRMALFQSGTYNLAAIAERQPLPVGCGPCCPSDPSGRVSVTNGIAAAGNSATAHPDAVRQVLAWMGSARGNQYLGAQRRGHPRRPRRRSAATSTTGPAAASTSDRSSRCSTARGYPRPAAPASPRASRRCNRIFDEMFLGRADVATTLGDAQAAANAAAQR